jgi:hypothetical protein
LIQLVIEPMMYHTSDEQANHSIIGHISQLRPTHVLCYLAKNRSIHASIEFTYKKSMKELFRNRKSKKNRHKMTKQIKDKSSTNVLTHAIHVQSIHVSLGCNVVYKMHMVISWSFGRILPFFIGDPTYN